MDLQSLPSEVLLMICQRLHYRDLESLSLVSKTLYEVSRQPVLWKQFRLTVGPVNILLINRILSDRRFSCLEEITFAGCELSDRTVRLLLRANVKKIKIGCGVDFDKDSSFLRVDPSLLGRLVNTREGFYFYNWELGMTGDQLRQIFQQMNEETRLRFLTINNNQLLSRIPASLYTEALNKLTTLSLPCQDDVSFKEFLNQMTKCTNIRELDLSYNNLDDVEPDLFGRALSKLEESIFITFHKLIFIDYFSFRNFVSAHPP